MLWVFFRAFRLNHVLREWINALAAFSNVCCDLLVRMCEHICLQSHCWTNSFILLFVTWFNKVVLVCWRWVLKRVSLLLTNVVLIIRSTVQITLNMIVIAEVIWRALECIDIRDTFRSYSHAWGASHFRSTISLGNLFDHILSSLILCMSVVIAKVIALWFIF